MGWGFEYFFLVYSDSMFIPNPRRTQLVRAILAQVKKFKVKTMLELASVRVRRARQTIQSFVQLSLHTFALDIRTCIAPCPHLRQLDRCSHCTSATIYESMGFVYVNALDINTNLFAFSAQDRRDHERRRDCRPGGRFAIETKSLPSSNRIISFHQNLAP